MVPAGLLAPFAIYPMWKRRRHRGVAYLLAWFVAGFVLLSLITTKQRHYALILLPPTALAAGWLLSLNHVRRGFPSVRTMEISTAVLAVGAAVWLGWWQPNHDDEAVVPGFMREAEILTEGREIVWTSGTMPWCSEFYFEKEIQSMSSVPKAWRRVPEGGAMIALERGKPLKGIDSVDGELVLDRSQGDVRCRLYLKGPPGGAVGE